MQLSYHALAVFGAATTECDAVLLANQLDRRLYGRTNKVLGAASGKWSRKTKAHSFPGDAAARIDEILLTGSVDVRKHEFNVSPSPPAVVRSLVELADLMPNTQLSEPSAGQGARLRLREADVFPRHRADGRQHRRTVVAATPARLFTSCNE